LTIILVLTFQNQKNYSFSSIMTANPATPIPISIVMNETGDFVVVWTEVDTTGDVTTGALVGAEAGVPGDIRWNDNLVKTSSTAGWLRCRHSPDIINGAWNKS
jgi:hypothetical protein